MLEVDDGVPELGLSERSLPFDILLLISFFQIIHNISVLSFHFS